MFLSLLFSFATSPWSTNNLANLILSAFLLSLIFLFDISILLSSLSDDSRITANNSSLDRVEFSINFINLFLSDIFIYFIKIWNNLRIDKGYSIFNNIFYSYSDTFINIIFFNRFFNILINIIF